MNSVTYYSSSYFFLLSITYRYQLNDLILPWSFFKVVCQGNSGAVRTFARSGADISSSFSLVLKYC